MIKKIVVALGHSLVLLALHLVYFNLNWSLPLEYEMMMMLNKTESFIGGQGRFDEQDYLFINTAYDQVLIETETEYGDTGTLAIADRHMLAMLFNKMAEFDNQHQYILCDLFFDHSSGADSSLNSSLKKIKKIIAPTEYDKKRKRLIEPKINIQAAQADYITYEGLVSKVRLYAEDSRSKTLPLIMFEDRNDMKIKTNALGMFYRGDYLPRSVYPRYFFDAETIKEHEMRLKQAVDILQKNGKRFYESAIQGKIIIIGNFSSDRHNTFVGPMPGSLVLFNTYLTLQAGYAMLGVRWLFFALLAFAGLCYYELIYKKERTSVTNRSWHRLFVHLLGVTGLCLFISILSGLFFGVHITIIPVIIYLELIRNLKRITHIRRKKA
jgi:hypothetical protein